MTSKAYDAYENDSFASDGSAKKAADELYNLKFSVDIRSVKNMMLAGNAIVKWQLNLGVGKNNKVH